MAITESLFVASNTTDIQRYSSERIHNHNCYDYLRQLVISDSVLEKIRAISPSLVEGLTRARNNAYDPAFPYADLYTQFFTVVENNIVNLFDIPRDALLSELVAIEGWKRFLENNTDYSVLVKMARERSTPEYEEATKRELKELNNFIDSIYNNDNQILESTFKAIHHIPLQHTPSDSDIQSKIAAFVKDGGERVNLQTQSPAQAGSAYGRFTAMMDRNFKPQQSTSLATVRKYGYSADATAKELRFGTQGQRDEGKARVSPLFERWLTVQEEKHLPADEDTPPPITHVYFNNLGRDRTDMEGKKERDLTQVLHQLEERHSNIAVITLPADKGLMASSEFKKTDPKHSYDYQSVKNEFLQIATQDSAATRSVKDFYISDKIRALVFQDTGGHHSKDIEKAQMQDLLDKSFHAMGIEEGNPLTGAQRQAVWFHFIKFELPNAIINKLAPQSVNFSCKDAIDRGGVSSAYYNLMKSIELKRPMTREEFDRGLHAAPTMVKARGMNHHTKLIWNAVDAYINANYAAVRDDPKQNWLIEWRDLNCPHTRVAELLKLRIEQTQQDLARITPENAPQEQALQKGHKILDNIQQQCEVGASGKRLLLEAVTRTPRVILDPTDEKNNERYNVIADKLNIKYPKLQVVAGMMKSLVALALYIPSFGHTKKWLEEGIATVRAGLHATTRSQIQEKMKEQVSSMRSETSSINASSEDSTEANTPTGPEVK